jgi:FlaA1/EpsC-like NDP-sugar epimerase
MTKTSLLKRMMGMKSPPKIPVIILGVEYESYTLHKALESSKNYKTAIFIDDDPWKHKTYIDNAQIRYPNELRALCLNNKIDIVIALDSKAINDLMTIKYQDGRSLTARTLLITKEELKGKLDIDALISAKLKLE